MLAGIIVSTFTSEARAFAWKLKEFLQELVTRLLLCKIRIDKKNLAHSRVSQFVHRHQTNPNDLCMSCCFRNQSRRVVKGLPTDNVDINIWSGDSSGTALVWHKYRPIWIKWKEKVLFVRGLRFDVDNVKNFVCTACNAEHLASLETFKNKIVVYQADTKHNYNIFWGPKQLFDVRDEKTLYLRDTHFDDLVRDIETFARRGEWYAKRGIPYKRGYMFYGPPGTGKSTTVRVLMSKLGYSIATINLSCPMITDAWFEHLIKTLPHRCVLLIEDVDSLFPEPELSIHGKVVKKTRTMAAAKGVSFNGFINALDGVAVRTGLLYFLSTNHFERLDPALLRDGRCDVRHEIGFAGVTQIERIVSNFFDKDDAEKDSAAEDGAAEGHRGKDRGFDRSHPRGRAAYCGSAVFSYQMVRPWDRRSNWTCVGASKTRGC